MPNNTRVCVAPAAAVKVKPAGAVIVTASPRFGVVVLKFTATLSIRGVTTGVDDSRVKGYCGRLRLTTPCSVSVESLLGGGVSVIVPLSAEIETPKGAVVLPDTRSAARDSGFTRTSAGSVKVIGWPRPGFGLLNVPATVVSSTVCRVSAVGRSNESAWL